MPTKRKNVSILSTPPVIGTLNESPLHARLKALVSEPGDKFEQPLGTYVVDIKRGDQVLEIQTGNFSAMRPKLEYLLREHTVRIIHPIAHQRWIVNHTKPGKPSRRRSPIRYGLEAVWGQFVSIPSLLGHPQLSVEVLLTHQDEVRVKDKTTRKRWRVLERRLLEVVDRKIIRNRRDLVDLLPDTLPTPFTSRDISHCTGWSDDIARQAAYCLRHSGTAQVVDKKGNQLVYEFCSY